MLTSSLCDSNKAIGLEVKNFISNVADIKEESITDYLVWKWRELDKRFRYINTKTFTRTEEGKTTGADFELELWLIGKRRCVPLLFQAKKFLKPYNAYVSKLNYPENTQKQLQTLLNYAQQKSLLPFYAIYTAKATTAPICGQQNKADTGVYMIEAAKIKEFADGHHGRTVSLNDLIKYSNPFHCLFCCPLNEENSYFSYYFDEQTANAAERSRDTIPSYVRQILSTSTENDPQSFDRINTRLPPARFVGVYDLNGELSPTERATSDT